MQSDFDVFFCKIKLSSLGWKILLGVIIVQIWHQRKSASDWEASHVDLQFETISSSQLASN